MEIVRDNGDIHERGSGKLVYVRLASAKLFYFYTAETV